MSQAALLKILPRNVNPAQVRSALTKVLKTQFESYRNFNSQGWLTVGLNGSQMDIADENTSTGTLYSCCLIFLALGLDMNDQFWQSPAAEWSSLKAWSGHPIQQDQSINF